MNKALLLHWWWSNSKSNWLPWLKKELERRLFDVYIPNLPNTNNPTLKEQEEYIDIYTWDFEKWWLIVWHSLWCQLATNFVQKNNINNSTIISVAPTYPHLAKKLWKDILWDSYDMIEKYYNTKIDFNKVNKLNNKFVVFLSDDDPYVNMENAKKYYQNLNNTKFIDFKNKWHFNQKAWILEYVENINF